MPHRTSKGSAVKKAKATASSMNEEEKPEAQENVMEVRVRGSGVIEIMRCDSRASDWDARGLITFALLFFG